MKVDWDFQRKMDSVVDSTSSVPALNKENQPLEPTQVVEKVIKFAKLELSKLNTNIQQVYFDESLQTEIKLLELNPATSNYLENGGKLILKGNAAENCVLCAGNDTFDVKDTEISNALLLVPGAQINMPNNSGEGQISLSSLRVSSVCHCYLELRPVKPRVNTLLSILSSTKYDGPENEDNINNKLTLNDIFSRVPASDGEILSALSLFNTVELDGYIRLVDFYYISRVVGSISALLEENSWQYDNFSQLKTLEVLGEIYPPPIIDHALKFFGAPTSEDGESSNGWKLNEDKVCRFFAEMLLRPTTKFNLEEFLAAWKESVPEGMMTSLSQTRGLAFVDLTCEPAVIRYFPVEQLSEDVKARFEQLFEVKDSWSLEEITPYIEPLTIGKLTVSVLVMKYARAFTKSGVKYYTAKYMKQ